MTQAQPNLVASLEPVALPQQPVSISAPQPRSTSLFDGYVAAIHKDAGVVQLQLSDGLQPKVGQRIRLFEQQASRQVRIGELEVVRGERSGVLARPINGLCLDRISPDDSVMLLSTVTTATIEVQGPSGMAVVSDQN